MFAPAQMPPPPSSTQSLCALASIAIFQIVGVSSTLVAQVAPDDPSVSQSLSFWLNSASTNFSPETGIWTDSSGNGRDAVPVGEVNVNALRNFLPPTATNTSGGDFSANPLPGVRFAAEIDDLLVIENANNGSGLDQLTIAVVYNVDTTQEIPSLIRPVGFGSVSAVQQNSQDFFNLASDPSIRKDNGQIGSGSYSQPFPSQTTFIRIARMSSVPNTIDEWFNVDGTLQKVFSATGASFTTSTDNFFLGDLRAGSTGTPGVLGSGAARAEFSIVQALAYTTALTDQQIEDLSAWLVANPAGATGNPGGAILFTNFSVAEDRSSVELSWKSNPGSTYAIDLSSDMAEDGWIEVDDSIVAIDEETTVTQPTFVGSPPIEFPKRVFYRVRLVLADQL